MLNTSVPYIFGSLKITVCKNNNDPVCFLKSNLTGTKMKTIKLISALITMFTISVFPSKVNAQNLPQLGKNSIEEVINAMTLEEKAHILNGTGMASMNSTNSGAVGETQVLVPGAAGTTYPIKRLGIPGIVLADGPAGLRI